MQTRIVFNGREYTGLDQMPEDVRKAFQDTLAHLNADSDHNGVPDVLEGQGNALSVTQASITINGRTIEDVRNLPGPMRWLVSSLLGYTIREATADHAAAVVPPEQATFLKTLDATSRVLKTLLLALSAFAAAALIVVGIWMIGHMDASSRSQGGAFYVGILVVIAVAWLVGTLVSLVRRMME